MDYSNTSACLLFLTIWLLPFFVRALRNSLRLTLAYWFVTFLHQAVVFANALLYATIGSGGDARTFHHRGLGIGQAEIFSLSRAANSTSGETWGVYENFLGIVYWLFGPSKMLGQELSVLAFAVSCIILIKIVNLLELSRYGVSILIAYGALPSMVLFGSVTLREPYQLLFFMLTVYWGIKMQMKGGINKYLLFMIMSAFAMGLFHNALVLYAVLLIVLLMTWTLRPVTRFWKITKLRLLAVFFPLVLIGAYILNGQSIGLGYGYLIGLGGQWLDALFNLDFLQMAEEFRLNSVRKTGRTTYSANLDLSSLYTTIYSSCKLYLYYLAAPFPWQIKNVLDVGGMIEAFLRMILIYFSVKHWCNAYGAQRRILGLMLILFFSMSFMWAVGTTNYGTAARHHMLSWWILVIAGLPLVMEALSRVRFGLTARKHPHSTGPTEKTF